MQNTTLKINFLMNDLNLHANKFITKVCILINPPTDKQNR